MEEYAISIVTAVWLGILTSISPCPLATNIAAISYIGKRLGQTRQVFITGIFYTIGRSLTYLILGLIIVNSILSMPTLSHFLQKYMNKILGPVLIITGMFLLDLIKLNVSGGGISTKMQSRVEKWGIWGGLLLGILFALSFCPVSAALFFGSLIPIAVSNNSGIVLPLLYGIGTALPVIVFSLLITFSTRLISSFYDKITKFELWSRRVTGLIFLFIGIYFCLKYIFLLF